MRIFSIVVFSIIFCHFELFSENSFVLEGKVSDSITGKNIPGAGIRISGTNRGTYSSSKGFFRLNVSIGDVVFIRSLGYSNDTLKVIAAQGQVQIKLKPMPIRTENVDVTAAITPEQIIERAVRKRDENKLKLKTFTGELYSKMVMELDGSLINFGSDDEGNFSMGATLGGDSESDSKRFIIMETYSGVQKDYEKNISQVTINKRRQTANVPSDQNFMAITEFVSFYDDDITFIKTTMPSPIGASALSSYNYTLRERIYDGTRYIYVLGVEPKSRLFPRFEGEVRIVEGTYNIVELELMPSSTTAIPLFENMTIKQKYAQAEEGVWYPAYLEVNAKAKLEVVKGLLDFTADVKATSIFSDAIINKPLPDSLYSTEVRRIFVSALADNKDSTFWNQNSLRELSDREVEIYARVDSAVKVDSAKSSSYSSNGFSYSLFVPHIDFNRVGSVSLGLRPNISALGFELNTLGYFSFGLQDYFGSVQLNLPQFNLGRLNIGLSADVYSKQSEFGHSIGQYHRLYNTIAGAFVHEDYNDYYQSDGFGIDINASMRKLNLYLRADFSRQFSLKKNTDKSIFEDYEWRNNLQAVQGDYQTARAQLSYGTINPIMLPDGFDAEINVDAFVGQESNSNIQFSGISGRLIFAVPTFHTGYNPMNLMVSLSAGIVSDKTPIQYQHRMATRLFILNNVGNFYTAPLGYYGGDEYYTAQFLYNISDIWWRWLGLPTYEGRGLDLTFGGTFGRFYNSTNSSYRETGDDGYAEAGFGFSRIPTFFSNIIFWSFDVRFGIGENAMGRTAGAISISLPL